MREMPLGVNQEPRAGITSYVVRGTWYVVRGTSYVPAAPQVNTALQLVLQHYRLLDR